MSSMPRKRLGNTDAASGSDHQGHRQVLDRGQAGPCACVDRPKVAEADGGDAILLTVGSGQEEDEGYACIDLDAYTQGQVLDDDRNPECVAMEMAAYTMYKRRHGGGGDDDEFFSSFDD
jgi:hypothetical protein